MRQVEQRGDLRARIATSYDTAAIDIGASIACDGVCLTVVDKGAGLVRCRDLGRDGVEDQSRPLAPGRRVNLERALRVGDELGGHIVSGHVDGVAEITAMEDEGDSTRVTLRAPEALARFIAPKGSITLNGVSLTVNDVAGRDFGINVIPHTKEVTTFGQLQNGRAGQPRDRHPGALRGPARRGLLTAYAVPRASRAASHQQPIAIAAPA